MRKSIIIVGAIALLLMLGFHLVQAAVPKKETIDERLAKYNKHKEFIGLRTENSRTFLEKDGRKTVILSTEPLNYRDENNQLQPIDLNLDVGTYRLELYPKSYKNNIYHSRVVVRFPNDYGQKFLCWKETGGQTIGEYLAAD